MISGLVIALLIGAVFYELVKIMLNKWGPM